MPYIAPERRASAKAHPYDAGELNFAITQLLIDYLARTHVSYAAFNEVVGVLECCKLELYRRLVVPYEDTKIRLNGDVYV